MPANQGKVDDTADGFPGIKDAHRQIGIQSCSSNASPSAPWSQHDSQLGDQLGQAELIQAHSFRLGFGEKRGVDGAG